MPATMMGQNQNTDGTPIFSNAASATGRYGLADALSGPTGSPKGGAASLFGGSATVGAINATYPGNTGGMSTGIGFGPANAQNSSSLLLGLQTIPDSQVSPGTGGTPANGSRDYIDNLPVGQRPSWAAQGATGDPANPNRYDSELIYIGGGRSNIAGGLAGGLSVVTPYTDGTDPIGFGNGGSRDGGAGPAFTGFPLKLVTAVATVANGAVIETGWVNRSGGSMLNTQNDFGSSTAASAAPV